jgi:hypothetical protein
MVFIRPETKKKKNLPQHVLHRQRIRSVVGAMSTSFAAATIAMAAGMLQDKVPMHTSILTGKGWLEELLNGGFSMLLIKLQVCHYYLIWLISLISGHHNRFHRSMGMERHVFKKLVHCLRFRCRLGPTKHLTDEEQVAIFLRIAKTGLGSREHQERFQRSGDTISK